MVAQFTEITGSSPQLATQYLQLADFNIEQAMQLYFENGGAPLTEEPLPSTSTPHAPPTAGREHESGVVNIDSDDDVTVDEGRSAPPNQNPHSSTFDDDAAMARRLQEEMYGGEDNSDGVRAPMARTTETLVGPEADLDMDDGDMHASILGQLRARQRGSKYTRPLFSSSTFLSLVSVFFSRFVNELLTILPF